MPEIGGSFQEAMKKFQEFLNDGQGSFNIKWLFAEDYFELNGVDYFKNTEYSEALIKAFYDKIKHEGLGLIIGELGSNNGITFCRIYSPESNENQEDEFCRGLTLKGVDNEYKEKVVIYNRVVWTILRAIWKIRGNKVNHALHSRIVIK